MKFTIDVRTERSHVALASHSAKYRRHITSILFVFACMATATVAQAQQGGDLDPAAGYAPDMPWMPTVIAATDAYVPDPAFNGGHFSLDHFADSNGLDQEGLLTAQLVNGNMVVAGLVPDGAADPGSCGDGTRLCSIGLVRYTPTGQRVTWPNAGANGRFSNNYVVYPQPGFNKYQYLRDVKVRGNYIDVMVDEPDANHTALTLGHRNVRIVTFRDDGSFVSQWGIFGVQNQTGGTDNEDFYGAQMVQMNSTQMIAAATAYDSFGPYVAVTRLAILGNGALSLDSSWGSSYGGGDGFNRLTRYYAPSSYCVSVDCDATASYVAKQVGFATQTDFYVAGSVHHDGNDWDPYALKISSADGSTKSEFNTTGWSRAAFDDANSTLDDRAAGLYVYQDDVYLAAQVSRKCFPGIGIAKLNGATGGYISAFGSGGKTVFGGQGDAPICIAPPAGDYPLAISATGGRIGIAGYSHHGITGISNFYDPMLAVVNAVDGSVLDFAFHPVTRTDGTRYGDAVLYGIYGGPLATSPFTVSGNGRDALSGNTLSYLAGRLVPVSSDRIFKSGFGTGDEL